MLVFFLFHGAILRLFLGARACFIAFPKNHPLICFFPKDREPTIRETEAKGDRDEVVQLHALPAGTKTSGLRSGSLRQTLTLRVCEMPRFHVTFSETFSGKPGFWQNLDYPGFRNSRASGATQDPEVSEKKEEIKPRRTKLYRPAEGRGGPSEANAGDPKGRRAEEPKGRRAEGDTRAR